MCRALRLFAAVLLLSQLSIPQASAQLAEEGRVRAVVERLFDAMRQGDGAALAALFHPDATLKSVLLVNGDGEVRHGEIADFAAQIGAPRAEVLDERISNLEIRIDGPLATAWMDYSFYIGERFSHCGVNAFELIRTSQGWSVLGITDTRRTTECF